MVDLQFGPFTLDPLARQLRRGGDAVVLPAKAFDLLLLLARNPGKPLTKKELLGTVWADTYVDESNLSQNISVLRKALGAEGEGIVVTLPGIGYQFAGRVTEVSHEAAVAVAGPVLVRTTESHLMIEEVTEERIRWWTSPLALTFAGIGVVLLGATGWLGWERYEDRVGGPPVQVVIAEADGSTGDPVLDRTLATLLRIELSQSPFVNLLPGFKVRAKLVEMEHKSDEKVTVGLAREVCERTGSQAVIHGSVARAGKDYLLTEEATNCLDGTPLGAVSRSVSRPEELPGAVSAMTSELRHSLGESRRTIARFKSPLYPVTTNSLEALEDFSEATRLVALGRFAEAAELDKKAVALDPNFATAWGDLSVLAYNSLNREAATAYLQKAYDLRDHATEPIRLALVGQYEIQVTGDLYAAVHNFESWRELYPRLAQPWSYLSVAYSDLGKNSERLAASRRTLELAPTFVTSYSSLAEAQMHLQDYAGARATCEAGIAKGLDGDFLRQLMLKLGYLQHDPAYIAQQEAWSSAHPDSQYMAPLQMGLAFQQGRVNDGMKFLEQVRRTAERAGQQEFEVTAVSVAAIYLAHLDELAQARQLMTTAPALPVNPARLTALSMLDDAANVGSVEGSLAEHLKKQPRSTLWNEWYGPILRANLLLNANKPKEALAALEPTRQLDGRDLDAMYLRGLAEMQLGQLTQAEAEFRKVLAHRELDAPSIEWALAPVQLARVLAMEGRKPEAAEAYRMFLTAWAHADAGQPMLLQVQKELHAL